MPYYPKTKKTLLNPRIPKKEYLNEHELYELLRCRELYNCHTELLKRLSKTLKGIEDAERVHLANIQAQKNIFMLKVKKMSKERLKVIKVDIENVSETGAETTPPKCDIAKTPTVPKLFQNIPNGYKRDQHTIRRVIDSRARDSHLFINTSGKNYTADHLCVQTFACCKWSVNTDRTLSITNGGNSLGGVNSTPKFVLDIYQCRHCARLEVLRQHVETLQQRVHKF